MPGDGLEDAAKAFDADIASEVPSNRPAPGPKKDITDGPPERLFGDVGELEVDDESPAKGGGDDEEPKRAKKDPEDDDVDADEDVDDEAGDDEEEEEEGEDAEFLNQEVSVLVDGEEQTVTLKEALDGYTRTQTFHKRMNEIEEAKQVIQQTATDAVQNYEYSVGLAKQIEAHLEKLVPPEPNWDEEFKKNPVRAREMQKYYDQVKGFRAEMDKQLAEANEKMQHHSAVQLKGYVETESKRFDAKNAKHWSADPKKKGKDLQAMRRTALAEGFTEEEVSQVYDSRMLQVLLKASKYDRMMASRPKPVTLVAKGGAKKVVPSGSGSARAKTANKGFTTAMKRLNKTGHIEDAAVVFDEIIGREGRRR
jgi:hypothetical protein